MDNGNGTFTYTSEDGTATTFDVTQSGTGNPNTNGTTGGAGDIYVDESTVEYLVQKGISRSRLTGRGYGETQLVNRCSDGVQCTAEEHQQNRRSEFIITKK